MHFAASLAGLALAFLGIAQNDAIGAEPALPRLTGIVVGPLKRLAIFIDRKDARTSFSVEEGGEIAGFRILTIKPDEVVLEGPSGTARLELEQDVRAVTWRAAPPPDLTDLRAQTTKSGEAIGLLAIQRDRCAPAGLLADVAPNSEEKLHRLIAAISNLPPREGADAAHDAPRQMMASAVGAGLEAAQRRTTEEVDAAACAKIDTNWRADAGRYGLQ